MSSVGAYAVQCANCFKWRLVTKEKYRKIRERLLEDPFYCNISCDVPEDISQDDSKLWAMDKHSIPEPPPKWERLIKLRAKGSTKFADVYYVTPKNNRLRSMVEVEKWLVEHPEDVAAGVQKSQFSFATPRPALQENYARKQTAILPPRNPGNGIADLIGPVGQDRDTELQLPLPMVGPEVDTVLRLPLPMVGPEVDTDLRL